MASLPVSVDKQRSVSTALTGEEPLPVVPEAVFTTVAGARTAGAVSHMHDKATAAIARVR
jgi:K+-transporting ATPase A subunit